MEQSFCEVKAPHLTYMYCLYGENGVIFSSNTLEAAPELTHLPIQQVIRNAPSGGALLSVSAAMRHGALQKLEEFEIRNALQKLEELEIRNCMGDGKDVREFMGSL